MRSAPPSSRSYWLATLRDIPAAARGRATLWRYRRLREPGREELFEAASRLGIGQRRKNIEWIADRLAENSVRTLVELGTQRGGNAFYLSQLMPSGSRLVTVDLHPRLTHLLTSHNWRLARQRKAREGGSMRKPWSSFSAGCSLPRAALVRSCTTDDCKVIPYFTRLDPHEDADFVANELFGDGHIDAIFYDADKRPGAVAEILAPYLRRLRPGGLLVLDDIRRERESSKGGMRLFWESLPPELRRLGETPPLPGHPGSGLGVAQRAAAEPRAT